MNNIGYLPISGVPTDPKAARALKEKIDKKLVNLHPDHEEKIHEKLKQVIDGTYKEKVGPEAFSEEIEYFDNQRELALQNEKKRNSVRAPIQLALEALNKLEMEPLLNELTYNHQYEITKSKFSLLKILKELEQESNSFHERIYREQW